MGTEIPFSIAPLTSRVLQNRSRRSKRQQALQLAKEIEALAKYGVQRTAFADRLGKTCRTGYFRPLPDQKGYLCGEKIRLAKRDAKRALGRLSTMVNKIPTSKHLPAAALPHLKNALKHLLASAKYMSALLWSSGSLKDGTHQQHRCPFPVMQYKKARLTIAGSLVKHLGSTRRHEMRVAGVLFDSLKIFHTKIRMEPVKELLAYGVMTMLEIEKIGLRSRTVRRLFDLWKKEMRRSSHKPSYRTKIKRVEKRLGGYGNRWSALALIRIAREKYVLRRALKGSDNDAYERREHRLARVAAINELGKRKDAIAVPLLLKFLKKADSRREIPLGCLSRSHISLYYPLLKTLTSIGGFLALPWMESELYHGPKELRKAWKKIIFQCKCMKSSYLRYR